MASSALSAASRETRDSVVIRFAGDSGDGMQVTGTQFTLETALAGNDLSTFPDFPAEIRAPAGTTFGVSAFQIQFGAVDVMTPGDEVDVLVDHSPEARRTLRRDDRGGLGFRGWPNARRGVDEPVSAHRKACHGLLLRTH